MTSTFWDQPSFSFLRILRLFAATQFPLPCSLHIKRRSEAGFSREKAQDTQKRTEPCTPNLFAAESIGRSVGMTSAFWDQSSFSFLRILRLFAATQFPLLLRASTQSAAAKPVLAAKKRKIRRKEGDPARPISLQRSP